MIEKPGLGAGFFYGVMPASRLAHKAGDAAPTGHGTVQQTVGAGSAREAPRGRRWISRAPQKHRLAPGGHDAVCLRKGGAPRCAWLGTAGRLTGACLDCSGVHEIERRPRGASRAEPAPTVCCNVPWPVRLGWQPCAHGSGFGSRHHDEWLAIYLANPCPIPYPDSLPQIHRMIGRCPP